MFEQIQMVKACHSNCAFGPPRRVGNLSAPGSTGHREDKFRDLGRPVLVRNWASVDDRCKLQKQKVLQERETGRIWMEWDKS